MKFGSYYKLKLKYNILNPFEIINKKNNSLGYSHNKSYEWAYMQELIENKKVLVPCNIIFFPYSKNQKFHMISQTTTGLATGNCIEEAILQSILEIIERDSYVISYLKQEELLSINFDSSFEILNIVNYLKKKGIKIHLKYLKNKYNVHVVHCVTESIKYPIYTHGSGAALDIITAIKRAIIECVQLRISQIELRHDKISFNSLENISYKEWGLGNKEYVKPFLNDINSKKLNINDLASNNSGNLKKDIEYLTEKLKKDNKKIFVANLSREFYDLKVVRVIIPGMQDIDCYNDRTIESILNLEKRDIFS